MGDSPTPEECARSSQKGIVQLHRLDLGRGRSFTIRFTFRESEIVAVVDFPYRPNRRERRKMQPWCRAIFHSLDPDARGLRIVCTREGFVISVGAESGGNGIVFFP